MDKCRSPRSSGQLSATLVALLALVALLSTGGALGPAPVAADQETLNAEESRIPAVATPQRRPYPHWLYALLLFIVAVHYTTTLTSRAKITLADASRLCVVHLKFDSCDSFLWNLKFGFCYSSVWSVKLD